MEKIGLYVEDICLGVLAFYKGKYMYKRNFEAEKIATSQFPLVMMLYPFKGGEVEVFEDVPYPFSDYVSATERADLKTKAKIAEGDSLFEKLYKLSKLKFMSTNFTIKAF